MVAIHQLVSKTVPAGAAAFFFVVSAFGTTNNYSIGINFGSDQRAEDTTGANPIVVGNTNSGLSAVLAPGDLAGVPGVKQRNWNNAVDNNNALAATDANRLRLGTNFNLVADSTNVAVATSVSVSWSANGTWATSGYRRLTENLGTNLFPNTPDNFLMTGYLDTGNATTTLITISNLPPELTTGAYHVYVYSMGAAVNQNPLRGGSMRIVNADTGVPATPYKVVDTPAARPTSYAEDAGANHTDNGNYVRFLNMTASNITIEATTTVNPQNGTPRVSVNAVELVAANLTQPLVTGASADARHFFVTVVDLGGASIDNSTVAAILDNQGTNVPVQAPKQGATTTVTYNLFADKGTVFVPGSTHQVQLTYNDTANRTYTNSVSFTVPNYSTVPPEFAVTGVDTSKPGFSVRMHQISRARSPGDRNTIANAERQLAGGFTDPTTGQPYTNMLPSAVGGGPPPDNLDGTYHLDVINWNKNPAYAYDAIANPNAADIGNFRQTNAFPADVADTALPGLYPLADTADPASSSYNQNIAAEVRAYLELPEGYYTFGVTSDEGFKLSVARGIGDVLGIVLGSFTGTRTVADSLFDIYVPTGGVFPVRLIWWEGAGAANCELFYLDPVTGVKVLINDQASVHVSSQAAVANPIVAYDASSTPPARPYVSRVSPEPGQNFVFADAIVAAWITDGTMAINAGTVSLRVNGTTLAGATNTGSITTISRSSSLLSLLQAGANTNVLVYSFNDPSAPQGINTVTNTWTFNVVPYTVLPATNAATNGVDLSAAGFRAFVHQMDRSRDTNQGNGARINGGGDANRMPWPEVQLISGNINPVTGLAYTNLAQAGPNGNWTYDIPGVLNYNFAVSGTPPVAAPANSGVIVGDTAMPGLPGTGTSNGSVDNFAAEFRTYLDLAAGVYLMAVNSDDGFVASSAPDPHDTLGTLLGFYSGGRGNNNPLPAPPASQPVPTPGANSVQANTTFSVVVPQAGIYPFRILYWQGGGGVNLEFFSIDKASGLQVLVGSTNRTASFTNAIPIAAYRTGPSKPWVKFSVSPTPWDNRHQQIGPGQILMYGRTTNQVNASDINNSSDATRPFADVVGAVIANGVGDPTLNLSINHEPVAATFTTNGNDITVRYTTPLLSGSTNTASLVYAGTTNSWSFIVQTYTNLNASDALFESAADLSAPGFSVRMFQSTNTTGFTQNSVARAEGQVAGLLPNIAIPGPGPNGSYIYPNIINWSNSRNGTNTGTEIGNFQRNVYGSGWPTGDLPDEPVPGIPGTGVASNYTDNCAAEIFSYWNFPSAGYYHLGINSDDGFAVKVGTPGVTNGTVIASVDVGKGSSDIPFSVVVPQAGLYPIRVVWYNGGGGANIEIFSYDSNGVKVPINGANSPIKTYYKVTSTTAPQFTSATVSGGQLMLTWSGTGSVTVQSASALTGSALDWTDGPVVSGNSYSVAVEAAGNKFYRLKQ